MAVAAVAAQLHKAPQQGLVGLEGVDITLAPEMKTLEAEAEAQAGRAAKVLSLSDTPVQLSSLVAAMFQQVTGM